MEEMDKPKRHLIGVHPTSQGEYLLSWYRDRDPRMGQAARVPRGLFGGGVVVGAFSGEALPLIELSVETEEEARKILIKQIEEKETEDMLMTSGQRGKIIS